MLYKKYHRNHIRQFKEGTVFKWNETLSAETVRRKPYYDNTNRCIYVTGSKYDLVLVSDDGQLIKDINVV